MNEPISMTRRMSAILSPRVLGGILLALLLAGLIIGPTTPIPTAGGLNTVGEDYVNIWAAATLTTAGDNATLYDLESYNRFLQAHITPEFRTHNWSYSPLLQLWIAPFAYLPYELGYAIWLIGSFALFLLAVDRLGISSSGERAFLLFSGAAIWVIITGQNGFLTAALFIYGMALRRENPVASALAFALLAFKPHLGLLIPVLLLHERNWRVIFMTGAFLGGMAALTLLIWGADPWIAYFTETPKIQWIVFTEWEGLLRVMMPSLLMAAELLGAPFSVSLTLQCIYGAGIFAFYVLFLFRCRDEQLRMSATWLCTLAIFPYVFVYDMMLYHVALLLLWQRRGDYPFAGAADLRYAHLLLWLWPLLGFLIALITQLQLTPLLYPALLAQWWKMRETPAHLHPSPQT